MRHRGLIAGALRRIARDPQAVPTLDRAALGGGLRSLHLRHCRNDSREAPVARPAHVAFYRIRSPDAVEIVRILNQRMELGRHLGDPRFT